MTSIAEGSVRLHTSSESVPSPPSWFGDVVVRAAHLRKHEVLTNRAERVRCARRRFGRDDGLDGLASPKSTASRGERPLEALSTQRHPFAEPFLAVCERDRLPNLAALRPLFLDDAAARSRPTLRTPTRSTRGE
jgi:hypothetical protein